MLLSVLNNPIRIIGAIFFKTAIRLFGLPSTSFPLFNILYTATLGLTRTIGVIPALRIVWSLRNYVNTDFTIVRGVLSRSTVLNQFGVQTLLSSIQPVWMRIPRKGKRVYKFFMFWFPFLTLSCSWSIISFIIKISAGLIFSTIGVLWSDTLFGIDVFKKYALLISDLLSTYLNFNIPMPTKLIKDAGDVIRESEIFSYFGLFLLGFLGLVGLSIFIDYTYPEFSLDFPLFHTVSEKTVAIFNTCYDWISSWRGGDNSDGGAGGTIFSADSANGSNTPASAGASTPASPTTSVQSGGSITSSSTLTPSTPTGPVQLDGLKLATEVERKLINLLSNNSVTNKTPSFMDSKYPKITDWTDSTTSPWLD